MRILKKVNKQKPIGENFKICAKIMFIIKESISEEV